MPSIEPQATTEAEVDSAVAERPAAASVIQAAISAPTLTGRVLALQRLVGNAAVQSLMREPTTSPEEAPSDLRAARDALLKGAYREGKGESVFTDETTTKRKIWASFVDKDLNAVLADLLKRWAPSVKDVGPTGPVAHSSGKNIAEHPEWVFTLQEKIIGQTPEGRAGEYKPKQSIPGAVKRWDQDSSVAQRLIEVYMRSWHRAQIGGVIPPNVAELYARVGASEENAQANLIGGEKSGPNWCGPASERAIPLGFMRRGLRFKSGKMHKPSKPKPSRDDAKAWQTWQVQAAIDFKIEVSKQGAHFITNAGWGAGGKADKKDPYAGPGQNRVVQRPACYTTPVQSGDYIYPQTFGSPVSGHVATVIQEIPLIPVADWATAKPGSALSTMLVISGNAGRDAVRAERVIREKPPKDYNYDAQHPIGNAWDAAKAKHSAMVKEAAGPYSKAKEDATVALIAWAQKNLKGVSIPHPDPKLKHKYPAYQVPRLFPGSIATMQQYFSGAGQALTDWVNATKSLQASSAEADKYLAGEKARLEGRSANEAGGMPLSRNDPEWEKVNRMEAKDEEGKPLLDDNGKPIVTGRWSPRDKDRIWVVAILKMSLLANLDPELAAAKAQASKEVKDGMIGPDALKGRENALIDSVASKYGLERMEGSIQEIYGDALEYWSAAGAFQ